MNTAGHTRDDWERYLLSDKKISAHLFTVAGQVIFPCYSANGGIPTSNLLYLFQNNGRKLQVFIPVEFSSLNGLPPDIRGQLLKRVKKLDDPTVKYQAIRNGTKQGPFFAYKTGWKGETRAGKEDILN